MGGVHHRSEDWRCEMWNGNGGGGSSGWCGWVVFEIMLITSHDPDIRAARLLSTTTGLGGTRLWEGMGWPGLARHGLANANPNANVDAESVEGDGSWRPAWRWRCARSGLSIFKHMEGIKWKSIKPKHVYTNHMKIDVHGSCRFPKFSPSHSTVQND